MRPVSFCLTILSAAVLTGLGAAVAAPPEVPSFTPAAFRSHVAFLADDLLEGRDTGSRGHEIAARYVAAQFEAYGLAPAGEAGGWTQQVTLQRTDRGEGGQLTISGPSGERRWRHRDDTLIGFNAAEPALDVAAPLVFVGYGIENARLGIDDYRGLDVKGRIVVTLRGFPKGMPSEEGAHVAATKAEVAERHGAIGAISIGTLQSDKANPWERVITRPEAPSYDWVETDGVVHADAPGLRAGATLHGAAAEAVFEGAPRTLSELRREADRPGARPRGFALKTRVRIEATSRSTRVTSPNVVGMVRGTDPVLADQVVVLSAHLDHLGVSPVKDGEPAGTDHVYNGALDNAAGIATMLEVARAMAAHPPRRSVLFLASTGEEKGLIGSEYFARHPTVALPRIVGNVDLDMPLLLYPFTDVVAFGAQHSTLGAIVAAAVQPMGIALAPDPMPEQGIFTRSDHYQFVKQGVPAVFLATGFANGGEKAWGAFLGGPYHHADDDLKQAIDWQSGARFAEANYRITRSMADGDEPPLWLQGDFFGDTFAPQAPRAPRH